LSEYFENNQKIFQEKHAKYLFSKIAKGVQEIHNSELCHLDLKLENILLDENYNPIICDFGFSMDSSQGIKRYYFTPGYAPKEIFEGKSFNGIRADIFSLGVVLFHIVTNKSIFYEIKKTAEKYSDYGKYIDEDKYYQLIKEGKNDDYWKVIIGEELDLSVEFKDLVINMIAYNPEVRLTIDQIINHPWLEEINKLTEKEKIYIVLEYMQNESLVKYFENNQKIFPKICAKYLFSKIAKGVQEIHKSGFYHLDLKLENIILDENYNPIICDFGFISDSSQII
jgi:serine/threonine protein kinase